MSLSGPTTAHIARRLTPKLPTLARVGPPWGPPGRSSRVGSLLAIVTLAIGGTACSGDGESAPTPTASAGPQEVDTPLADVQAARLELPGDPDWLASDEHGIWVQRASGELTLVDPATNELSGSVALGDTQLCAGLGSSFGSVWTCLGPDVVRVDPESLSVVARLDVGKQAVQGHLVGGFERVWVLTSDGSRLVGIDPATNRVATQFQLPARCSDVSLGAQALWLPCRVDDRVLSVDPASGDILLDAAVDNPVSIAVDDDEVWVGTMTATLRLDPATGEPVTEVDAPADGGVTLDEDSVWVRSLEEFLVRVDRATGKRVQQVVAEGLTSVGDLLVRDGEIWTTAFDDQALLRLDPDAS